MLLTHSVSRSLGAEWLISPKLRMPTIRLLLLITGNLRTFSASMCRTAWRGRHPRGSNGCPGSLHCAPSHHGHRNRPPLLLAVHERGHGIGIDGVATES